MEKVSEVDVEYEFGSKERHQKEGDRDEEDATQGRAVRASRAVIHLDCSFGRLLIRHRMGYSVITLR